MSALWSVAKTLKIPLDTRVEHLEDLPYTISFVVKKRMQIDNLMELPKEKRPSSKLIWEGSAEDLEDWLEAVINPNKKKANTFEFVIPESQIEG